MKNSFQLLALSLQPAASVRDKNAAKTEIEFDREIDGRWIAEVGSFPGVLAYGAAQIEARIKVEQLARIVAAERALKESDGGPPWKPTKPRS
jgi:hypothetical protein